MFDIAIVEDHEEHRELLKNYILRYFGGREDAAKIRCYPDGEDFLKDRADPPDVVFLDIVMERLGGMETARRIRETNSKTLICFVTEMYQYALDGYSVNAVDYLVKPVRYESFCGSFRKILRILNGRVPKLMQIDYDKTSSFVDIASIYYIETDGKKMLVHTASGDYPCAGTMKAMEEKLKEEGFARCHQAYLVNLRYVETVRKAEIVVCKEKLPVSRYKREEFLQALTRFVGAVL
ncbi:MAG: response regulator transcription factor [Lachnospiraceae bacterium]|nr:response regulator transcription factor [Lachnospiraceae bacterium]